MRFLKSLLAPVLVIMLLAVAAFAGNCGTDQFPSCQPQYPQTIAAGSPDTSAQLSVRTGNGNYARVTIGKFGTVARVDSTFKVALRGTNSTDSLTARCYGVQPLKAVTCVVSNATGTSDSAGFATLAFPSLFRPGVAITLGGLTATSNSVTKRTGSATFATSGLMVFNFPGNNGTDSTWANSGTNTVGTFVFSFLK